MQNIIVAVDGSAHSLKGVAEAGRIAEALGARVRLAYVLPPILLAEAVYADTIKKIDAGNRAQADDIFTKARAALSPKVEVDAVMLNGAAAEAIADLAAGPDVWGVVIGAKGHSAVSRVLLGSVTDRLVHICTRPVLVIR